MPLNVPHWRDDPVLYDVLWVGGQQVPGIVVDVDAKLGNKFDVLSGPGASGAAIQFQGYQAAPVKIAMKLWTRNQWARYQSFRAIIQPRQTGKRPVPVDVSHPMLVVHELKRLYVESISIPKTGEDEVAYYSLDCLEYFPPRKLIPQEKGSLADLGQIIQPAAAPATSDAKGAPQLPPPLVFPGEPLPPSAFGPPAPKR
jgi:hypothetical protein